MWASAAASGGTTVVCMPKAREEFHAVDLAAGEISNDFVFSPVNQKSRVRVRNEASGGATLETRYGWDYGHFVGRTGMCEVGSSHVIGGVLTAMAGSGCEWSYGAVVQLNTFVEIQVHRAGFPWPLVFPREYALVKGLGATEGQTFSDTVSGSYHQAHSGVPVLQGDRLLARVGIRILTDARSSSLAKADLMTAGSAGDEMTCVSAVISGAP